MIDFHEVYQAFLHAIIVYILLLVLTRIIGKKLLGQITFFDFVIGISLGTIGGAFVTTEVKGFYVLLSASVLAALVFLTGLITLKSTTIRKLIEGEPIVVIQNGKIFENNMRKVRYNQDDLAMQLREKDVFDFSEVEFAILEPHGKLSVLKKSYYQAVTPEDLNRPTPYKGLSTELIRDGRIEAANLRQNNLNYEWLYNQLANQGIKEIENVFLASLSTDGTLYIDEKKDRLSYIQRIEDDDSLID